MEMDGNLQDRTKRQDWTRSKALKRADIAWNTSLVPASITRQHSTGRVLDAESSREGVESEKKSPGIVGER